jgi:hypothetical protein
MSDDDYKYNGNGVWTRVRWPGRSYMIVDKSCNKVVWSGKCPFPEAESRFNSIKRSYSHVTLTNEHKTEFKTYWPAEGRDY